MLKSTNQIGSCTSMLICLGLGPHESSRRGCLMLDLLARCIGSWICRSVNSKQKSCLNFRTPGNWRETKYQSGNTSWLVVTGTMEFYDFPYVGNNNPIWLIFFTGVQKPPTSFKLQTILDLAISFDAELLGFNPFRQEIWWKALTSLVSFVGSASCGLDPSNSQQILGEVGFYRKGRK